MSTRLDLPERTPAEPEARASGPSLDAEAAARRGSGLESGKGRKMSKGSRILIAVGAISLALVYVQPLWKISLQAPQYPEGIGMQIWVNDIRGEKPNDLKNINGLNHYIGMKQIHPESIPELRFMPWIIGILLVTGLVVALIGDRRLLYLWAGLFLVVAAAGLVDFYLWEYDYGHNLDPTAAIKIPGMSYQPPLLGPKQLLNFVATSWPGVGGWAAVFSCGVACLVAIREAVGARRTAKAA